MNDQIELKYRANEPRGGVERENNYDFLRLLSCFAVVLMHANWEYWGDIAYDPTNTLDWVIGSLLNIVTRFSVPSFAMITGAFFMNNDKVKNAIQAKEKINWKSIYRDVTFKTFIPFIVALIIQVIIQILTNILTDSGSIEFVKYVVTGAFANLWYFYMLAVLYFIIPVLVLIKTRISKRQYILMTVFMTVWAIASQATSEQHVFWSIGVVVPFVAYFLLGDVLYDVIKEFPKRHILFFFALLMSFVCIVITFIVRRNGFDYYLVKASVNFFSPTIVLYSICFFVLFGCLRFRLNVYALSKYTFMIYVWHMLCMRLIKPLVDTLGQTRYVSTIMLALGSLISAFVVGFLFSKIWEILVKSLDLKNKWQRLRIWKTN